LRATDQRADDIIIVPDPRALHDFLTYARNQWAAPAPRFVLLVGKASYDYRDSLKGQICARGNHPPVESRRADAGLYRPRLN